MSGDATDESEIVDRLFHAARDAMDEEMDKLHNDNLIDKDDREVRRHYEFQTGCAVAGYLEGRVLVLGMQHNARKRIFRRMHQAGLKTARDVHLDECCESCAGHSDIVAEIEAN